MVDLEMRICFCGREVESKMSQISTSPSASPIAITELCHGDQAAAWMTDGRGGSSNTGPSCIRSILECYIINKMAIVFTSSTDFQIAQILPPTDRTVLEMWGAARMSTTGPSWKAMHRLAVHAKQNLFEFTSKLQWKKQTNLLLAPFPSSFSNLLWKFLLLPFRRRKWADRRPYRISALRKLQKINFVLKEDKLFFFTVRLFLRVIDHGETCDGHVATLVSDDWKHLQIWRR